MRVMPYSMFVGQERLKLALELAYIAPKIGGVLLSGERGTGKSTLVRAFAQMVHGRLPVTLPINATEDRVVGGWDVGALLRGEEVRQRGLLEEADGTLLYIDEVNLLDDHIVNIILDATSTGILAIEREGRHEEVEVHFTMVGTMNPSEGGLRPQLLDRFGLMVSVASEQEGPVRVKVLEAVLEYDAAITLERRQLSGPPLLSLEHARERDRELASALTEARSRLLKITLSPEMTQRCVRLGQQLQGEGHRADFVIALAACAHAARRQSLEVEPGDLSAVARLALQHRRPEALSRGEGAAWTDAADRLVDDLTEARSVVTSSSAP